jgi:dynein heavy chain
VVSSQETHQSDNNAGPLEGIQYWEARAVDLSGIQEQLERPAVGKIIAVLKLVRAAGGCVARNVGPTGPLQAGSSYLEQFRVPADRIQAGCIEARENLKFLRTLQAPCERLAAASPAQIPGTLTEVGQAAALCATFEGPLCVRRSSI